MQRSATACYGHNYRTGKRGKRGPSLISSNRYLSPTHSARYSARATVSPRIIGPSLSPRDVNPTFASRGWWWVGRSQVERVEELGGKGGGTPAEKERGRVPLRPPELGCASLNLTRTTVSIFVANATKIETKQKRHGPTSWSTSNNSDIITLIPDD